MSEHAHLYDRRWRKRRAEQLRAQPLCAFHLARGVAVIATVADHVVPHRGDPVLFAGPLQSLCTLCHNSTKRELETSGTLKGCDVDGLPLDPNHPWRAPGRVEELQETDLSTVLAPSCAVSPIEIPGMRNADGTETETG